MPGREKLSEFTAWCAKHITGDEKGQAFGLARSLDVGGHPEFRIRKAMKTTPVLTAYGFSAKKDLLAQLLALNQDGAAKIA